MSFYVSTATFFLLHCDEWDRVVALPRHKFVTGATLLQLIGYGQICQYSRIYLYSACLLPSVDGLVKKNMHWMSPDSSMTTFPCFRSLPSHCLVSLSLNKCVLRVRAILLVSKCIKITFILTLIINR